MAQESTNITTRPVPFTDAEFTIRPLNTLQDFLSYNTLRDRAFGPNELFDLCWPQMKNASAPSPTQTQQRPSTSNSESLAPQPSPTTLQSAELTLKEALSNHRQVWTGVFSPSNDLLGLAHWYYVDDPSIPHDPHGPRPNGATWGPGTNIPLADAHFGQFKKRREQVMKGKQFAYMCLLIVAPEAQRRGLGERLLKLGLEDVDAKGWEAWIEATPAGLGLYKKLGWEVREWVETDLKEWGGTRIARDALCVRPAKGKVEG